MYTHREKIDRDRYTHKIQLIPYIFTINSSAFAWATKWTSFLSAFATNSTVACIKTLMHWETMLGSTVRRFDFFDLDFDGVWWSFDFNLGLECSFFEEPLPLVLLRVSGGVAVPEEEDALLEELLLTADLRTCVDGINDESNGMPEIEGDVCAGTPSGDLEFFGATSEGQYWAFNRIWVLPFSFLMSHTLMYT